MNSKTVNETLENPALAASQPVGSRVEIGLVVAITALWIVAGQLLDPSIVSEQSVDFGAVLVVLSVIYVFHRRRGDGWAELGLARPRSWWKTLFLALPAAATVMLLAGVFQTFVVAPLTSGQTADISRFAALHGDLPKLLVTLVSIWLTAAFAEEVIYRGFLMGRLARLLGGGQRAWWAGLVLSSVAFGLLHLYQGPAGILLTGFVGFLFGMVYLLFKRNLWVAILVHALVDTISLTAIYLGAAS